MIVWIFGDSVAPSEFCDGIPGRNPQKNLMIKRVIIENLNCLNLSDL